MEIKEGEILDFDAMSDSDFKEFLDHYGTRGMKWGIRRGKSVTGVGRARGAIIDSNDRVLRDFKNARLTLHDRSGATRGQKFTDTTNRMLMGRKRTEKYYNKRIKEIESQTARIKSGRLKAIDRLQIAAISTMPVNMLLSARPK